MLTTLAVGNYRSLLNLTLPLTGLNLISGANGCGKSNLYRALRLLALTAQGGVIPALAREGGLESCYWAGPEQLSRAMREGRVAIQGGPRQHVKRLRLGFAGEDFSYAISLGLPEPSQSFFSLDPEIKREVIWAGPVYRPAAVLVERKGPVVRRRQGRSFTLVSQHLSPFDSLFDQVADLTHTPEVVHLREQIRGWRFYDHFRTDHDAPARQPQLGTRTPILHADGRDLAAALQTIREIGDHATLERVLDDAFAGARLAIEVSQDGRFHLYLQQPGLLRPLSAAELSDGTLRFLLWLAALLSPRPPSLMVLNEPETSLHPDLLPALAQLIRYAASQTQVWVVSHSLRLIQALEQDEQCQRLSLSKSLGATELAGQGLLNQPPWQWPD